MRPPLTRPSPTRLSSYLSSRVGPSPIAGIEAAASKAARPACRLPASQEPPSRRNDRAWVRFHESGIHSKARAMHGWIILDKPVGLGSTQAVAAVKSTLRTGGYPKRQGGHGGTLDPLATGVFPIAIRSEEYKSEIQSLIGN